MRASDFLALPVLGPDGDRQGVVIDVRAVPEPDGTGEIALVVDGFIVGRRGWRLLGYERATEYGPWVMKWLVGRLHRDTRYASWADVDPRVGDCLRLRRPWADLPHLHRS